MKSVILDPEEAEDFEEIVGSKSLQVTRRAEIIHRWQPEPGQCYRKQRRNR